MTVAQLLHAVHQLTIAAGDEDAARVNCLQAASFQRLVVRHLQARRWREAAG